MEYKIEIVKSDKNLQHNFNNHLTPSIKSGFNSYYIDKLKHLKTAISTFKTKDATKGSKPYKIISPMSVSKDSLLNEILKFGTKQDNYIVYEIFKNYKLKGNVYSMDEKTKKVIKKINIKNLEIVENIKNCDIIFNNSKIEFLTNFYNQEVKHIKNIKETIGKIKDLKNGGNCIFRIYNLFLNDTLKEIIKICNMFDKVFIFKPETTDNYKTDKYIICLNKKKSNLENNNYEIKNISEINTFFINSQVQAINEVINYINKRNYRGLDYQMYMDKQHEQQKKFIEKLK